MARIQWWGENPENLLKLFFIVSILGVVIVLWLSYWAMSYSLYQYNIQRAERDSVNIGYTLYRIEHDKLIDSSSNKLHSTIPPEYFNVFDQHMRALLEPMNVIKIKVFSPDEVIVYSTDHELIGQSDFNNHNLKRALNGEVVSRLENKESAANLSDETRFDIDVVETYLPMYDQDMKVQGAFEVYVDITPYREHINQTIQVQIVMVLAVLLIIFSILTLLMWRGTHQLSKVQDKLQYRATHDALTRLYSRGYLRDRLKEELARVQRASYAGHDYQAGIVLLDIDYFKKINDQYGHLTGDRVLIAVAERMRQALREEDVPGRYGGEEFLVIFPMTNVANIVTLARRLWEDLRSQPLLVDGKEYSITASLGVSNLAPTDNSTDDVLNRADIALYRAKADGRDRVDEELCIDQEQSLSD